MKKLIAAAVLLLPLAALADTQAQYEQYKKDVQKSDTTKNTKSKLLSKIGADITPSPAGAKVYIVEPKDGAEVKSPVKVVFGLAPVMGVAPAGTQKDNTGHHHLLIDDPQVDMNAPLPTNPQIKHFGNGQTEAMVELKPGKHTLQLLLGDWKHQPHSPPVQSEKVTITVK
jgi:hypothetical protein